MIIFVFYIFLQPLIIFLLSWYSSNFSETYLRQNLSYTTDISGYDGLPDFSKGDQLIGLATNEESCQNGFYLGPNEQIAEKVNCSEICNATSAKQFEYKYITDKNIVINNRYLRRGGWCLPTQLARCNLNISLAVKSVGKYECVSRHPKLLGGAYGNDIVGCAPIYEFRDNLKKIIYSQDVPSTLSIDNLDEKLPNGEYRYTCNTTPFFSTFENKKTLGNRFQLHYNACKFFDPTGTIGMEKCICPSTTNDINKSILKPEMTKQKNSIETICSTCTSGYGIVDEENPQIGSKYGVSIGINCVDPEKIEYFKTLAIEFNGVLPCGLRTLTKLRTTSTDSNKTYGCHRTLLNVTNTYSPEMLQRILG